ncbi:alanine racemase [Dermatobacter hominis]|uniref:alanine racemase n=1 Tax=Dermatobacter hominis TaxID=2884263 RepID=UPI001D125172|nr:alanine racemase [Dermatobacter hominis]UDY38019.1 alanine racemase [Dermatobacter hominis]
MPRHAAAHVDLDAVAHNVAVLKDLVAPAELCVVVKADGYGHGAEDVAHTAVAAGADRLAVALVEEGQELRDVGVEAPVLVLSQPPADAMADAFAAGLTPTVDTAEGIDAAAAASSGSGWAVHLKVDTGMHRVGCDPADAVVLATRAIEAGLRLEGTFTHLAVADEPERPETSCQLERFAAVLARLADVGVDPGLRHAANSAGALLHPDARMDLVRVGIATYGVPPAPGLRLPVELRPAMVVSAEVSHVGRADAGEGVSYGLRHRFDRPAELAVVPLGYADGVPRRLGELGAEVLIGGVRRPIRGVVTMDQLVVEVTGGPPVSVGDEAVLLGRQGDDEVTADEWAELLGTISYEIVCGFGPRLPRRHLRRVSHGADAAPAALGDPIGPR